MAESSFAEVRGTFVETAEMPHVSARLRVLGQRRWVQAPPESHLGDIEARGLVASADLVRQRAEAVGAATVYLDRGLTNEELLAFADTFGEPMQHRHDGRTAGMVHSGAILNLRAVQKRSSDIELGLLFANNAVPLHSEMASYPRWEQPRWLVFECVTAPAIDSGGQTLLVSMADVVARLPHEVTEVLKRTSFAPAGVDTPILWRERGRAVLSFKDSTRASRGWRHWDAAASSVDDALQKLLAALYSPREMWGLCWRPRMLAVIDNRRYLHARTQVRDASHRRRHLRRVRVRQVRGSEPS